MSEIPLHLCCDHAARANRMATCPALALQGYLTYKKMQFP